MRQTSLGLVGLLFIVLGQGVPVLANATSIDCHEEAMAFLATPNEKTALAVSGVSEMVCWKVIESSNANLNHLIHSVENGNRWAAQYLAKHLKSLDGGNLEDSLIALGQFAGRHMEYFLDFAKEGSISDHELKDALTMLPLSLSDNPTAQLKALKARKTRVMKVTRADLRKQRVTALKAIDDFVSEIRAHDKPTPGNPGESNGPGSK